MKLDDLTNTITGLAIKIHRQPGPGLLESVYQAALAYELQKANIKFEKKRITCSLQRYSAGYWI
jgi:GxxExxY protein